MKKIILIMIIGLLFIGGCTTTRYRPSVKTFTYEDSNDTIINKQKCIDYCLQRQSTEYNYFCEYKPITCNGNICLCETY